MKVFFDFALLALFFISYKLGGIYAGVAAVMIGYSVQMVLLKLFNKPIDRLSMLTFCMVIGLGGLTFLFHDELFFKWKPTIVYAIFAGIFACSQFFGQREPAIKQLFGQQMTLPKPCWIRLNIAWVVFFMLLAVLNIVIAYQFDTNTWVNFKVFGTLLITVLFLIAQCLYIAKQSKYQTSEHESA